MDRQRKEIMREGQSESEMESWKERWTGQIGNPCVERQNSWRVR